MKQTRFIMGGPVTVEIVDPASQELFDKVFDYFNYIDEKFSTYKSTSEISAINTGKLEESEWSDDVRQVMALAEETKHLTHGYFDIIGPDSTYDPSGLVKGWAVRNASEILREYGMSNFYVEAAGDIETAGHNAKNEPWTIGIQNPFSKRREIVKILHLSDRGVATSGTYARGLHIYDPLKNKQADEIVSLTVVGPNAYESDRFATAAFAMGHDGISFIETLDGFEAYSIDKTGVATMTSNFIRHTQQAHV